MKTILGSRRNQYLTRVSIFLIMAVLIGGAAACGVGPDGHSLYISSTRGGSVATPGEGQFYYPLGKVVNLVAEAEEGCHFVKWTGDVWSMNNTNAAVTTITMWTDYEITADFCMGIFDWYDLDAIRYNLGDSYLLMNDLDSTAPGYEELASPTANNGTGWQPIEFHDPYDPWIALFFTGSLDGQGYEICDLFINRPDENVIGLFSIVGEAAVIENVGLVNVTVTGEGEVGSLAGLCQGVVRNCYSTGNVTGKRSYVGGLVGCINEAVVSNCYSTSSVTGFDAVGGLVGNGAWSTISNSYSAGSVTGNYTLGCGLVGLNFYDLTVTNSFWDTETSGTNISAGGTGMNTTEMQDIATFLGASWDITAVANSSTREPAYIWNIVDNLTYPFLSWQP
jgi:Divergent InlB B-repeat domain/The GLUG motif